QSNQGCPSAVLSWRNQMTKYSPASNRPHQILKFVCHFRLMMLVLLAMALWGAAANAQYRASLRGTVTDQAGAVVPEATVTLTNTDTNATIVAKSDANGIYQFNALAPAHFRITAEHPGFKKKVLEQ